MAGTITDELAVAAARLVVEEGMDYAEAKRKAVRQAGRAAPRGAALPSNEQVETEVREHIALFCADTQPAELHGLRCLALQWMDRLAEFRPYLAGAVWRGTATRRSAVHLDLYCDDAKSAEIALINQGVDFDTQSRTDARGRINQVLTVAVRSKELGDWVSIHLSMHDHDDLRGALRPDSQGQSWRGDATALRRRLAESGNPLPR